MTTNETTTDPATELAALYPLMTKAGCWPERIRRMTPKSWAYYYGPAPERRDLMPNASCRIEPSHALAIVRDAAEDWLRGREWEWSHREKTHYRLWDGLRTLHHCDSLTAAIEAELERGEG